jgi:nicotinamidase/pyrazinamidase
MRKTCLKALLIVDAQNDFLPGGSLAVVGGDKIIPNINKVIEHALANGWYVIVSRDKHPLVTAHFKKWPQHCVGGTPGAEFPKSLMLPQKYILVTKGKSAEDDGYSPFEGTNDQGYSLNTLLALLKIRDLYFTGLATDWCVKAGVLDALELRYRVHLLTDAVAAVNLHPQDGENAIGAMHAAGALLTTTQEVLDEKN